MDFDSLVDDSQAAQPQAQSQSTPGSDAPDTLPNFDTLKDDTETYGGAAQTVGASLEGGLKGLVGPLAPSVEETLGISRESQRGRAAAHPIAHGIGEGGALIGGALTGVGEAAAMEHVGNLAVDAAGLADAVKGTSYLGKVGASAVKQAAEMATLAGSDETTKMALQDPDASAETAIANIGMSAALGGAAGAFITGAVSPLWKAAVGDKLSGALKAISTDTSEGIAEGTKDQSLRPILKKVMSTFGGVPEADIDAYLQHHEAIQNVPEFADVYSSTLDHVGKISDAVEDGKMSVSEAKSNYKDLERALNDSFRQQGSDAATAAQQSKMALNDAQTKLAYDIHQQALGASNQVAHAVDSLRNNIVEQSGKAYDLLEQSNVKVPIKSVQDKIESLAKDLEAEGTIEAKTQADRLRQYGAGAFHPAAEEVSGSQAKKLIQGLDKVSKYDYNSTAFDKNLSRSYKQIRGTLDEALKSASPEYKAAMKPLAKDSELLSNLSRYGTDEDAVKAINSLKNPATYKNEWPLLKELEGRIGVPFTKDIEPYANAELRAQLEKSLPEYAQSQVTAEALNTIRSPKTKFAMAKALAESAEAKAQSAAEAQLSAAKAAKDEISGVTPATLQGKLASVAKPSKNLANVEILKKLPEINGMSVPDIMNLIRIKEAFEKNATRGSKHVNLYGAMIGSLGTLMGEGIPGVGLGSMIGAAVDNSGPQVVKKLLDKYMEHFGNLSELAKEGQLGATKSMLARVLGASVGNESSEGFKAGVDYMASMRKGDMLMSRAAANVLKPGAQVLTNNQIPTQVERLKLDKMVADNQDHPSGVIQAQNGKVGHYLPDHQTALTQTVVRNQQYLQTLKPKAFQPSPLDRKIEPTQAQNARYYRALDIAQQPAIVLKHVKDGTIQTTDLMDLKTMYPAYYQRTAQKLTNEMMNVKADDEQIPYKTRVGISLFLGQPLDTSMQPTSIQAAQPQPKPMPSQQGGGKSGSKKGTSTLGKSNKSYQTPGQAAESDRGNRE